MLADLKQRGMLEDTLIRIETEVVGSPCMVIKHFTLVMALFIALLQR